MQKLQPKMKQLQQKHKGDRQKLNEEMMGLYKEHKVNPLSGCLPMLLQLPVFLVMYQVIRGLTRTSEGGCEGFDPKYLDEGTRLFRDLCTSGGKMKAFGVDLARTALQDHGSIFAALPFFLIVALVVFVQYYQTRQMTRRNPQSVQSAQLQMMTKIFPAFFGVISLSMQAGLNVYFLVSGIFRVAQQGAMYKWDPTLAEHVRTRVKEVEEKTVDASSREKGRDNAKGRAKPDSKSKGQASKAQPSKSKAQSRGNASKGQPSKSRAQGKASGTPGRANGGRPPKKKAKRRGR
jgi:YidC/Oxa1 family membrane protein insertase